MAYAAKLQPGDSAAMDDISREALEVAENNYLHDQLNRNEGIRDLQFLANDQWDARDRRQREQEKRPVLTINRLIGPVKLVANSIRFSVPAVKVAPVDQESDESTAWTLGGLVRQIQRQNMATWVYAVATGHAAACGIGHWRILTDYVDDDMFDQEIKIELIPHPFSVLWDAAAVKPDRSDAKNCLVLEYMPRETFRKRFPGAAAADFQPTSTVAANSFSWFLPDVVVIAEYWRMTPRQKKLGQLADGRVIDLANIKYLQPKFKVIKTRDVTCYDIEQTLVSGREVLKGPNKWAGKYIPVVPIIGNEIPLESTVVRHGIVRFARDPQRMYNYWRSQSAEWIGQAAKSPWLVPYESIEDYIDAWDTANTAPRPYLPYKVLPENPQLKPERNRAPEPPAALWQEGNISSDEIKTVTGLYNPSLGAQGNEVSGKAIAERQSQGDLTNFEFTHNLQISLNHTGRILLDLAPKIYDTTRTLRILDEFEKEHFVPINSVAYTDNGQQVLVNDMTAGKYDVVIKLGPSYQTRRQESAAQMVEFLKLNPDAFQAVGDIVAEEQDWPGAAKLAKRLKKMVPPDILGDDADSPPPQPDPLVMEGQKQEVREKKASADKKEQEAILATAQAQLFMAQARAAHATAGKTMADAELSASKAQTERMTAQPESNPFEAAHAEEMHQAELAKRAAETQLVHSKVTRERVGTRLDVHKATKPQPGKK